MAYQSFAQGDDVKLIVDALDRNNAPIDLTLATNIILQIYVEDENGVEHQLTKYSLVSMGGYGDLIYPGIPTNQIQVKVVRTDSITFPVGILKVCLVTEFPEPFFNNNRQRNSFMYIQGRVLPGCGQNILIP